MEEMELTIEEKQKVQKFQEDVKNVLASLGSLRKQFRSSENTLIAQLEQLEQSFMEYLSTLAKERGKAEGEDWIFDPNKFGFIKK